MSCRLATALVLSVLVGPAIRPHAQTAPDAEITEVVSRLQEIIQKSDGQAFDALLAPQADRVGADQFAGENLVDPVTRVTLRERDRGLLQSGGYRVTIEIFAERGQRGRISTWRLDLGREAEAGRWQITDLARLAVVDGLYRLSLNGERQYDVRSLTITGEDLTLSIQSGTAFAAEADGRPTALVIRGRGEMEFHPKPPAERGQLRIFAGKDTLRTSFDQLFLRIHPDEFESRIAAASLVSRPVDRGQLRDAQELFAEYLPLSFSLDLNDLSRETWSLTPTIGDLLAEIRTRRFGTLTYARSLGEAEDITLFDRRRKRNISLYASEQKLAARGRFYSEDDRVEYDVLDYDISATFAPEREWIDGVTTMRIRTRATAVTTFTVRLGEELVVRSASSREFGRLLTLRVRGQNNILVNLPGTVPRDTTFSLTIAYSGRQSPQPIDREALSLQEAQFPGDVPMIPPEDRFLYSQRSYWYPQSTVSDYSTATLRLTVPSDFAVVATGELAPDSPTMLAPSPEAPAPRRLYEFEAKQPIRYVSCLISRFTRTDAGAVPTVEPEPSATGGGTRVGVFYESVALAVEANPRQVVRARDQAARASEILQFYGQLIGDSPYPAFTLALVEGHVPGGHSPAYFALLNQPLPTTPFVWRNDPVNFDSFPDFFLAHELAHQWWGQAVGWRNYHEQWLSEGFAQYFAALYAQRSRGQETFDEIVKQMRRTAMQHSDQGPVYLGYRLGHLEGQSRVFRALVYNKGAMVLHMLRRLIGDRAFFQGVRRFYVGSRFRKASTEDLRRALEAESGRSLERFFERWIYADEVPRLRFSHRTEMVARELTDAGGPGAGAAGPDLVLRFEQGEIIHDVPVTVTIKYASGVVQHVVVPVTDDVVEMRVPLQGPIRGVEVNQDFAALAEIGS
jgi:hypothetical protein